MLTKRHLTVPLAGAAVLAAGCGSSGSSSNQASTAKTPAAAASVPAQPAAGGSQMMMADTGAKLVVLSPRQGTVVSANDVPFDVAISHFKVECEFAGTPNRMGAGHYHVELDGSLVNMYCSPRDAVSLQNVKPGPHTLTFIPAENDHTDDMKAAKKVSFVYQPATPLPAVSGHQAGAPSIRILSPAAGSIVQGSLTITVAPSNFNLSCALYGKADVPGYGHWHLNVDSTSAGMMGMGTMMRMSCQRTLRVSLAGIKPGRHTFFAILEDNQHAPTPHAQASVTVDVR